VVSALTAVPRLAASTVAMALGALAVAGVVYASTVVWRLTRRKSPQPPHWSDYWCYGYGLVALYLALGAAALAVALGAVWSAHAVAAVMMATLLLAIRNAWDLVTWLAPAARAERTD
jgi:hypothetical protein